MAIYQVSPATGLQIIWSMGDGRATPGGFTAEAIDNDISRGTTSIMGVHLTLFNSWLTDCKISTDVGGEADTQDKRDYINNIFWSICYYAYAKHGLMLNIASGKCDCKCEANEKKQLKYLSEELICKYIRNACLKEKYLNWLHGICDTKKIDFDFWGSELVEDNCQNYHHSHHHNRRGSFFVKHYDDGGCESCGS